MNMVISINDVYLANNQSVIALCGAYEVCIQTSENFVRDTLISPLGLFFHVLLVN